MSFGSIPSGAEAGVRRSIRGADACPCGSGDDYEGCCGPLHAGAPAPTAERLMRSRYSAFALGDAAYLTGTWHPGTRPDDLALDPTTRWIGLEIVEVEGGQPGDRRGIVEFNARSREGSIEHVMHERSRFVFQSGRWWYVDGAGR